MAIDVITIDDAHDRKGSKMNAAMLFVLDFLNHRYQKKTARF